MHVLGYFAEPGEGPLQDELAPPARGPGEAQRATRAAAPDLGLPVSFEEVRALAGSSVVGRPHFAAVLVQRRAASVQDAFDRLLAKGAPGYVPKARIDFATFVASARGSELSPSSPIPSRSASSGPGSMGSSPSSRGRSCRDGVLLQPIFARGARRAAEMAKRHDLVATGGSDFHGRFKPDISVGVGTGDLEVPDSALAELSARSLTGQLERARRGRA